MAARFFYDVQQTHKPRIYREFHGEPYTESEFPARYRFSEESIEVLTNLLYDELKRPTHRIHAIPVTTQIKIALRFMHLVVYATRFPCVIGAVDGTHIRFQAPSHDEYAFVNRKNYHSINVQGICDHEGKFTNIVAKWPGSTHDSFIFRNSDVGIHMDQTHRGFNVDGLLLGDNGYACTPYLMTPYLRPST
ncbi:HARBI1 [Mytilus coruscus]|uniref:HARBI1 n=1 Tax=Mytilus coruscus TaxID=42192 RepID=A0A6J8E5D5_MYTCO|nr:HARBI1 [Mytilus coruscus]